MGVNTGNDTTISAWNWNYGNGITDTGQVKTYTYPSAGNYILVVKATNKYGCTDAAQKTIAVVGPPAINAGADTIICLGKTFALQPSGATNYVWASSATLSCTNCANPVASPVTDTKYFVTGYNAAGCSAKDSLLVQVKQPIHLTASILDSICIGQSVALNASGADVYSWQPTTDLSDPTVANPVASPSNTTTYTVTGSDNKSCFTDKATVTVRVFPKPSFNILDTLVWVNIGSSDTLLTTSSPDVISWQWTPSIGLSCYTCAVPVVKPKNSAVYTAVATNAGGCTATDQVTVKVICNGANFFIPNTLSPNTDGMNDRFFPRGSGLFSIKSMRIFNRWGQLVFEKLNLDANNFSNGWDGTYNGKQVPQDVYIYVMEVICENGELFSYKGNITLIR